MLGSSVLGVGTFSEGGVLGLSLPGREDEVVAFGARPPRLEARFLLTSITKALIAVQLVILSRQGALDLDAPIRRVLPELGAAQAAVTPRHILSHTAGISPRANLIEGPRSSRTARDYLAAAMRATLTGEPGARFAYSSPGYWTLAELIARTSGLPHDRHLQVEIAEPLGLSSLRYESGARRPQRYVLPRNPRDVERAEQVRRAAYPAGGALADARDLLALGRALIEPRPGGPFRASDVLAMSRPVSRGQVRSAPVTWASGWELGGPGSLRSARTLFHSGASGTALWVDLDVGLVLTALTADWRVRRRELGKIADRAYRAAGVRSS